jgi:hypothetical protein
MNQYLIRKISPTNQAGKITENVNQQHICQKNHLQQNLLVAMTKNLIMDLPSSKESYMRTEHALMQTKLHALTSVSWLYIKHKVSMTQMVYWD